MSAMKRIIRTQEMEKVVRRYNIMYSRVETRVAEDKATCHTAACQSAITVLPLFPVSASL